MAPAAAHRRWRPWYTAAVLVRRPSAGLVQRRNLQSRRIAAGAGKARHPLSHPKRHRSPGQCVASLGGASLQALCRHVCLRRGRHPDRRVPGSPRPLRRQAALSDPAGCALPVLLGDQAASGGLPAGRRHAVAAGLSAHPQFLPPILSAAAVGNECGVAGNARRSSRRSCARCACRPACRWPACSAAASTPLW